MGKRIRYKRADKRLDSLKGGVHAQQGDGSSKDECSRVVEVKCYLHDDSFAQRGWYPPEKRSIKIGKKFSGTDIYNKV